SLPRRAFSHAAEPQPHGHESSELAAQSWAGRPWWMAASSELSCPCETGWMEIPGRVETLDQLIALFRAPGGRAVDKELDHLTDGMAAFIERSPFLVLATSDGQGSVDASPRGGPPGFVRRLD